MHCPNCGKQTSLNQKFCRSCGMSLETVSKVLTEHLSVADSDRLMAKVNESLLVRRMYKMLLWGIIAVIFGIALLAIGKNNGLITLPGLLIALAGMLLAVYGVLSPLKAMALSSRQSSQPKALKQPEPDLYLPPKHFSEPVPSVTERTTELLEIENARISK